MQKRSEDLQRSNERLNVDRKINLHIADRYNHGFSGPHKSRDRVGYLKYI